MSKPEATHVLHSLRLLRSGDAKERIRGITVLSHMLHDPRVLQVFEYLYQNDPDADVREAAWYALTHQGPAPGKAGAAAPPRPFFLLDPANARIVTAELQRQVRERQGTRGIPSLVSALLLLIGLLWGIVLPDWWIWYRLREYGVTTTGQITSLPVRQKTDTNTDYYVTYRFVVGENEETGVIYTAQQRVTRRTQRSLAEDMPVTVTYVPDNPDISHLDYDNPAHFERNQLTIMAAGLTAVMVLIWGISSIRSRVSGGQDRRIIWGQVLSCTGQTDADGDFSIKLRYSFRSPEGRTITGQVSHIRNDLTSVNLPSPGIPLAIYYRNEQSHRVL